MSSISVARQRDDAMQTSRRILPIENNSSMYLPLDVPRCSGSESTSAPRPNNKRGLSLYTLISHDGVHIPTEACRDIESPAWQRVAVFTLKLRCEKVDGEKEKPASTREPSSNSGATEQTRKGDEGKVTTSRNPFAQSLNPFADNFVPPPPRPRRPAPTPPPEPATQLPLRTSLVLHLRVLSDSLISKEVVGEVAVDLVPLLESGGDHLATDRLGHVGSIPLKGLPDQETLAVDTWVALRERTGELRVQILMKPGCSEPAVNGRRKRSADLNGRSKEVRAALRASVGTKAPEGGTSFGGQLETQGAPWPEFDKMARAGLVKTTLGAEQLSLDDRLLEVQEQYDFSAATGYRQGRPDGEAGDKAGKNSTAEKATKTLEWPERGCDAAQLRRCMQLAFLRNRRQCVGERIYLR